MIRGEVWWADLGIPVGREPGFRRPVVIIQDDAFNRSRINTTIVTVITSNLNLSDAPGNVYLESNETGLPKDGVVNISQIVTIDKQRLMEKVCMLPPSSMSEIEYGIKTVLNIG